MNEVQQSGAKWEKEIGEVLAMRHITTAQTILELARVAERAYKEGQVAILSEIDQAMHLNEPQPGWWPRVRVTLRAKYDL